MPEPTDQEIVEKAMDGDRMAFRQLVERHQGFVYRVAYRFVRTSSDAQDITQETFVRLWKHLSRYRKEIRLTTWLYKIVSNLCLDLLKSTHAKHSRQALDVTDTDVEGAAADEPLLHEELRTAVEKISDTLSPKQKAVFILRDMEDRSVEEIAQILGMSAGQIKSNLYYARKRVSEEITLYYQTKQK